MPRKSIPRLEAVCADRAPFALRARWRGGEESVVDVSGPISTFRIFAPLRNAPDLFGKVRVGEDGTDIAWTDEIDMSAEMLWRLAREQSGATMSPEAFRRWRERKAYTLEKAARELGLSRRTIAYYEQGSKPIPRVVALATRALEQAGG